MILGLLAERPWTAYDLVRHLRPPALASAVWNMSERTIYREPAKLVAEGLATASTGDEQPTVYSITEKGRAVLTAARYQSNEFVHRNEVAATLYAVAGEPPAATAARLLELRGEIRANLRSLEPFLRVMASTGPTLPGRAVLTALLGRLQVELNIAMHDWIEDAIARLGELTGDGDVHDLDEAARAAFAVAEWISLADMIERVAATWTDSD